MKGWPTDMSHELTPAQRQELFDLLLAEFRSARDTATAGGVPETAIMKAAAQRRHLLGAPDAPDDGWVGD
jgi:hypothetical protein